MGTFVHVFHLEDDLECRVEHFVQALFLLGGADDEALEGVLLGGRFDLSVGDAFAEFGRVAGAFELLAQIKLGADQDARACPGSCLDLSNPFLACVLERISARQAEADEEAVGVDVGERAQSAEILAASIIPDPELELDALVVLRHIFSRGKHSRLAQDGEGFVQPGHNERGLADAVVAHEH